jgi:hypothetical protein
MCLATNSPETHLLFFAGNRGFWSLTGTIRSRWYTGNGSKVGTAAMRCALIHSARLKSAVRELAREHERGELQGWSSPLPACHRAPLQLIPAAAAAQEQRPPCFVWLRRSELNIPFAANGRAAKNAPIRPPCPRSLCTAGVLKDSGGRNCAWPVRAG